MSGLRPRYRPGDAPTPFSPPRGPSYLSAIRITRLSSSSAESATSNVGGSWPSSPHGAYAKRPNCRCSSRRVTRITQPPIEPESLFGEL